MVDVRRGKITSKMVRSCAPVSAGAFFPPPPCQMPQEEMGQHRRQPMLRPAGIFPPCVVSHPHRCLRFFAALGDGPPQTTEPDQGPQGCSSLGHGLWRKQRSLPRLWDACSPALRSALAGRPSPASRAGGPTHRRSALAFPLRPAADTSALPAGSPPRCPRRRPPGRGPSPPASRALLPSSARFDRSSGGAGASSASPLASPPMPSPPHRYRWRARRLGYALRGSLPPHPCTAGAPPA